MGTRHYKPHDLLSEAFNEQLVASVIELIGIGKTFYDKNWALGTSGNFSALISRRPFRLLITASGRDKGRLTKSDFVLVDELGKAVDIAAEKPSAETLLHTALANKKNVYSVLHTHSVYSTILSDRFAKDGEIKISGYEMQKGLAGITTHESTVRFKIFENTQKIAELAEELSAGIANDDPALRHGFLIRKHGLYTWGKDLKEARRHVEIIEFLLEVIAKS